MYVYISRGLNLINKINYNKLISFINILFGCICLCINILDYVDYKIKFITLILWFIYLSLFIPFKYSPGRYVYRKIYNKINHKVNLPDNYCILCKKYKLVRNKKNKKIMWIPINNLTSSENHCHYHMLSFCVLKETNNLTLSVSKTFIILYYFFRFIFSTKSFKGLTRY